MPMGANTTGMIKWNGMSGPDKVKLFDRLAVIYEKLEYPEELQTPGITNAYSIQFASKRKEKINKMSIEGVFGLDKVRVAQAALVNVKNVFKNINGGVDINIFCRAALNTKFGTIKNAIKVEDNSMVDISHNEDQVTLIMFWASWCKVSQAKMAEVQKMLNENNKKWGDKVRVMALSVDQDQPKLRAYIEEKKLNNIEHYNVRYKECKAMQFFGVKQIPLCVLLNKEGKLVFTGRPNWRVLNQDI